MGCVALFCYSRSDRRRNFDPNISFHAFPTSPQLKNEWIKVVGRDNWQPTRSSRLCSIHFEKNCFKAGLKRRRLHSDAIPTIFQNFKIKKIVKRNVLSEIENIENIQPGPSLVDSKKIDLLKEKLRKARKEIKSLKQIKKRSSKRIGKMWTIISKLKKQGMINTEN